MGAVLYETTDAPPRVFAARPSKQFLKALLPRQKQIVALELVTVLVAYTTWRPHLRGKPFQLYIDNDAANRALTTGFSSRSDLARLAGLWWLIMARDGAAPWLWRVPSAVNPADYPTRPKEGWRLLGALHRYRKEEARPDWEGLIEALKADTLPEAAVALGGDLIKPYVDKEEGEGQPLHP